MTEPRGFSFSLFQLFPIFPLINSNDYSSVAAFKMIKINILNVRSLGDQSVANARSSNITRLPLLMPIDCQEFVFGWGKETERRE